jgi:hypothetical protein
MRKIYLSFLGLFAVVALNAQQYDVEVNLIDPTAGSTVTATNGFEIDFSFRNNGPGDIPAGDSMYVCVLTVVGATQANYGIDNNPPGSVTVLTHPVVAASTVITASQIGGAAVNDLVTNMGGAGTVCMFMANGPAAFTSAAGDPNEVTMENNISCFEVNALASAEEIEEFNNETTIAVRANGIELENTSNESLSYVIVSLSGQTIDRGSFSGSTLVSTEGFNNGIYIINVSNGNTSKSEKFAITK